MWYSEETYENTHGRKTILVYSVWEELWRVWYSKEAHENTHRRETISMHTMWKELH
jgi:hypothetical protein